MLDRVVSGLVLNFVPEPARAIEEFARVLRPGGTAAALRLGLRRRDADDAPLLGRCRSRSIPPRASSTKAGAAPSATPTPLEALFSAAGLRSVTSRAIDIPTVFADFDDYWQPFLAGRAPAPAYAMSLDEDRRSALRDEVRRRLPVQADGSIPLIARAWAVQGTAP